MSGRSYGKQKMQIEVQIQHDPDPGVALRERH